MPCHYSPTHHDSPFTLLPAENPAEGFYFMHWLTTTLKSSFTALLGSGEVTSLVRETRTEDIRQFTLDELGIFGEENYPQIIRRVRYAKDIQELWYMRGSVMTVLSAMHGETVARNKITVISDKFKGLLPRGLNSRSSPLSSSS